MKIKPLTKEQIIISIDRLTRFKNPETKYLRVFYDILLHNLIEPKYSRAELEIKDCEQIKILAQDIINFSLNNFVNCPHNNLLINKKIYDYENSIFMINNDTKKLINNEINYSAILEILPDNIPKNLRWLKSLTLDSDIKNERKNKSFQYPVELLILAEGVTEETLLPEFAKLCNFDFDKEGIYLTAAGGKNQVVKLYYELYNTIKLPIFILFDKDGEENATEIIPKLRSIDKIHLLNCGEFEDLLPERLFERALNYELQNISIPVYNPDKNTSRVKILEDIFKKRGMHEFKKAEFAKTVKKNILSKEDISPEMYIIIDEIKSLKLQNIK